MKKLYVLLLILVATFTLTGCGKEEKKEDSKKDEQVEDSKKDEPKVENKSCQGEVDGVKTIVDFTATDGKVNKIVMTMTMSSEDLGGVDLSTLSDSDKKEMKDSLLEELDLPEQHDGVEVTADITDVIKVTYSVDLEKASKETLKAIDFDLTEEELDLDKIIESGPFNGFTC